MCTFATIAGIVAIVAIVVYGFTPISSFPLEDECYCPTHKALPPTEIVEESSGLWWKDGMPFRVNEYEDGSVLVFAAHVNIEQYAKMTAFHNIEELRAAGYEPEVNP
jgi:hypothetical protein